MENKNELQPLSKAEPPVLDEQAGLWSNNGMGRDGTRAVWLARKGPKLAGGKRCGIFSIIAIC